ncbi:MAG: hypothetical protein EZS28_003175 [Streblomastix strix]|uniref:PAP-associated domain-containing protein n=1 Tax=Streblomastix strix TaxID=222440 RepID=A0A5J4X1S4_9EUKA|nr:MAG: hypothetical protein EZS28_003175 [Streblomastix strix]
MLIYPAAKPIILVVKDYLAVKKLNEPFKGGMGGYALSLLVVSHLQQYERNYYKKYQEVSLGRLLVDFFRLYGEEDNKNNNDKEKDKDYYNNINNKTDETDDYDEDEQNETWKDINIERGGEKIFPSSLPQNMRMASERNNLLQQLQEKDKERGGGVQSFFPFQPVGTQGDQGFIVIEDPLDISNNVTRTCWKYQEIKEQFCEAIHLLETEDNFPKPLSAKKYKEFNKIQDDRLKECSREVNDQEIKEKEILTEKEKEDEDDYPEDKEIASFLANPRIQINQIIQNQIEQREVNTIGKEIGMNEKEIEKLVGKEEKEREDWKQGKDQEKEKEKEKKDIDRQIIKEKEGEEQGRKIDLKKQRSRSHK